MWMRVCIYVPLLGLVCAVLTGVTGRCVTTFSRDASKQIDAEFEAVPNFCIPALSVSFILTLSP